MLVWILQTGEPLHSDSSNSRPMRAINLSNKLIEAGHDVILWSSSFDHQNKTHRSKKYKTIKQGDNLEIRLIPSRGYKKHIGLGRLIDHIQMAWNLNRILKIEKKIPDIAFIGYPPIETAFVISQWLRKRKVPILLDVKDLWPSIFIEPFPSLLKPIARTVFSPYFILAKKIMNNVNGISTMSDGFMNWCLNFSNKSLSQSDRIVRLTTFENSYSAKELDSVIDWWSGIGVLRDTKKVFFAGTFSKSAFNFDEILSTATAMKECQFVLCGHGPYLAEIKDKAKNIPNVVFPGWINRLQLEGLAKMSLASLAPYIDIDNFTLNIPNKIVDSLLLSTPILSPLKGEVSTLIESNAIGFVYDNSGQLTNRIQSLINDSELQKRMSNNAKELYNKEFEFNEVYDGLVVHLENMALSE